MLAEEQKQDQLPLKKRPFDPMQTSRTGGQARQIQQEKKSESLLHPLPAP